MNAWKGLKIHVHGDENKWTFFEREMHARYLEGVLNGRNKVYTSGIPAPPLTTAAAIEVFRLWHVCKSGGMDLPPIKGLDSFELEVYLELINEIIELALAEDEKQKEA